MLSGSSPLLTSDRAGGTRIRDEVAVLGDLEEVGVGRDGSLPERVWRLEVLEGVLPCRR
jgi:hypothetical protein